jgi:hypothetical protein
MCCGVCAGQRGAAVCGGECVSGLWWSCHGALVVVASVVAIARSSVGAKKSGEVE